MKLKAVLMVVFVLSFVGCSSLPGVVVGTQPEEDKIQIHQLRAHSEQKDFATLIGAVSKDGSYGFMDFAAGETSAKRPQIVVHSIDGQLAGSFLGGVPAVKVPVGMREIGVSYIGDKRFSASGVKLPKFKFEKDRKYLINFKSDYRGENSYTLSISVQDMTSQKEITSKIIER